MSQALPHNTSGLVDPTLLIAPIVLLVLNGLRDKTIFLAARGEQYLPALFFFTVLPFVDMIIALKLLIVVVWVGAGVSKFGKHFANVIPPMVSNSPCMPFKWVKRAHYRDFPRDLRPSRAAHFMAHVLGTTVEIVAPLVLLFSTNKWLTVAAVVVMVAFHLFIISTFPLAVPLEWNVLFAYATIFLFLGFPAWHGYAVSNMSSPWLTATIVAALVFFPILGNLRPGQGVVPAVDAPVRRQLGLGGVGVRPGRGGETEQRHAHAPATRSTSSSPSDTNRSGPRSRCSAPSPGARCTARAVDCFRCC